MTHPPRRLTHAGAALLVAAVAVATGGLRARQASVLAAERVAEDVYYLPVNHDVLRVLTLGFREAATDLLWMKALLYYGENMSNGSGAVYAVRYAEALVALDPSFTRTYHWAGLVPFYLMVETPLELREQGAQIITDGSDRYPEDGPLAWDAASTVTYELLPHVQDPERRRYWQEVSARLLQRAVRLEAGPAWLSLNAASALEGVGQVDAAVESLSFVYSVTSDEALRSQIAARIQTLQRAADQRHMELEHRRLTLQRQAEFPYLDPAIHLLVGERRIPPPP